MGATTALAPLPQDVWRQLDQVLLNSKLGEIAEEMHLRLAEDKARAHAEGRKRGNSGFYAAERIRLEKLRADEWAEKIYQTCLQIWGMQGYQPSHAFYRALYQNLLAPLFGTRKGTVTADMIREDHLTRRPGHSAAALDAFSRAMDQLSSNWKRKLDIAARENEYAMQRTQESGIFAGTSQFPEVVNKTWDFFISHASEDKDEIARPLAEALRSAGYRVWFDEFTLRIGDRLRKSIDQGLAGSKFGVVILSKHFFEKHWPEQELDGLASKEIKGQKVILPVWHRVTCEEVRNYSPMLADRVAVSTDKGFPHVVEQLKSAIK